MPDYEDIFEGLRNGGTTYAKEGTYSLPIHSYSEVLYYNTAFFEENGLTVPATWDELIETSKKSMRSPVLLPLAGTIWPEAL